ncbi:MAG: bile acid:sodium symporter family protein [Panacagrimonas sp.]
MVLFLTVALGIIMLSLGLSLTVDDFRRVLLYPRAVIVALACQMLLLPGICLLIVLGFALPPELAVGMMLLSATPGGVTANLFSHISNGDVALNISLTAINSLLALFTLPLILGLSMSHFLGEDKAVPPQFSKIVEVFTVVVGPVVVGMFLRTRFPAFAQMMNKAAKPLAAMFLLAIAGTVLVREWNTLVTFFPVLGGAALAFNLLSLSIGYGAAMLARLEKRQAIAISMEVGIHNATLAIAIALSPAMLNNPTMAIPGSLYAMVMLATAAIFGYLVNRIGKA